MQILIDFNGVQERGTTLDTGDLGAVVYVEQIEQPVIKI